MFYAKSYGFSESFRMHSLYVALLTETGIVGIALYLGAVLVGCAHAKYGGSNSAPDRARGHE